MDSGWGVGVGLFEDCMGIVWGMYGDCMGSGRVVGGEWEWDCMRIVWV